uniref:Uncharacterized protein n=1 Tax=Lactuca sativa TaxID=4236 RepID=A0A9R1VXU8_LACSA|nr:hypothetical protein LSAT_V11C300141010 [Lactuca sativa]
MDALALKEEKCKVLAVKLQNAEQQVDDLPSERAVVRSCITDITCLLYYIIETRDSMISITSGVRYVISFGGCFETGVLFETRGRIWLYFSKERTSQSPSKPVVKKEPKGKETLFENEPFIGYDDEDEEPDEAELKRRKVRKAELNENARIVKEAEEKERAENEAHATLKSRMLLFHSASNVVCFLLKAHEAPV